VDIDRYQTEEATQMPGMEGLNAPKAPEQYVPGTSQMINYYHGGVGDKLSGFHPATADPGILPSVNSLYPKARFSFGGKVYRQGGLTEQVAMGTPIESKEHMTNPAQGMTIAMQHLVEDPKYYTKLKKAGLDKGGTMRTLSQPVFDFGAYAEELATEAGHEPGSGVGFSHGGVLDALGDDMYMLFGVQEPDTSKYPKSYKKGGTVRSKPGGSNVGKDRKTSKAGEGPFVGPSGGAPKGSYPVTNKKQWRAAKAYARHAPNPSGIRAAADRVARRRGWLTRNGGLVPVFTNGGEQSGSVADLQWDTQYNAYMLPGLTVQEDPYAKPGAGASGQGISAPNTPRVNQVGWSLAPRAVTAENAMMPDPGVPNATGLRPPAGLMPNPEMDPVDYSWLQENYGNLDESSLAQLAGIPDEETEDVQAQNQKLRGPDYWTQFLPDAANLLNTLTFPKVPGYDLARKTSLEEMTNRDVINKIMQSERTATQAVQQNMSQQGAAAANVQGIHANTMNALSSESERLRNLNAQIRNQEAQLNQQIEALNTGTKNRQKDAELSRLLAQRQELSKIAANVGNKLSHIQKEKNLMGRDALALDLYKEMYNIPGVYDRKMRAYLDEWMRTYGVAKEKEKVK
jgi:hypothetical protein